MSSEYLSIVEKILSNRKYQKLKNETHHHNSNRYKHSLEVSYLSYKLAKKMNLDYESVAKAGLVHDFFFDKEIPSRGKRLIKHYEKSITNAEKLIKLNDMEKNIISSHMFPIGGTLPKYKESLLVDMVDDYVSIKEKVSGDLKNLQTAAMFITIVITNFLR